MQVITKPCKNGDLFLIGESGERGEVLSHNYEIISEYQMGRTGIHLHKIVIQHNYARKKILKTHKIAESPDKTAPAVD